MNIFFRADANSSIGMGHVMRCLSIADSFRCAGCSDCQVEFIVADDTVVSLIKDRGYKTTVLHSDYKSMDDEIELWSQDEAPDLLIVDSYYVTERYLRTLRDKMRSIGGKLVYIDDVLSFPYPVDILINYGVYASAVAYHELYSSREDASDSTIEEPRFILGPAYTPLREMFRGLKKKEQPETVKNILLSTGGSDELHLALAIILFLLHESHTGAEGGVEAELGKTRDMQFHFLVGTMNTDRDEIERLSADVENIVIHKNVMDMKSLICSCDLAIAAAGSTTYEIAACGVPLITYALADNQIPGGKAFERFGLGMYIGDLRNPGSIDEHAIMSGTLDAGAVDRILSAADELSRDYEKRKTMSTRMQSMIDGYGADRMVEEMTRQ